MPVELARNLGFGAVELGRIQKLVEENEDDLLDSWHDYFGQ